MSKMNKNMTTLPKNLFSVFNFAYKNNIDNIYFTLMTFRVILFLIYTQLNTY